MYEKDGNVAEAIENYAQAATFFETENSKVSARTHPHPCASALPLILIVSFRPAPQSQTSQCNAKVAELCSAALTPPDLPRAADIYESLGKSCLDSALIKYNAKGYFLSCIFCHLALGDAVAAGQRVEMFGGMDFSFR